MPRPSSWVDRDMFMRYLGGGIGHMNQDSQGTSAEALDDEMDVDSDTPLENDEDEEESTSSSSTQSSTSGSESDSDNEDEIDFGPEDNPKDMNLSYNLGYSAL